MALPELPEWPAMKTCLSEANWVFVMQTESGALPVHIDVGLIDIPPEMEKQLRQAGHIQLNDRGRTPVIYEIPPKESFFQRVEKLKVDSVEAPGL